MAISKSDGDRDAALPRVFGPYVLFDQIGRGGMAEIFLALVQTQLGGARRLVIKEILPHLSTNPAFAELLVREAKLAVRLTHRNIVQITDLGRESGRIYIAMAYVEGYDLNQLLRQLSKHKVPLPAEFALFVIREVLAALDYAHRAKDENGLPLGIVHRDVSPSNVLISFEGEVSLCDFGIARAFAPPSDEDSSDDSELPPGMLLAGKSGYMAPEHARGDEVDLRSDIFAAGILLWELCAGRRMYKGSDAEVLDMARAGDVPPMPDRGLPMHELLQSIVERALARDPAQRFQTAAEMSAALDDYMLLSGLAASQLRFGRFLSEHFAEEIVTLRHARELAAQQLSASIAPTPTSYWPPPSANQQPVRGFDPRIMLAASGLAIAMGLLAWLLLR